MNFSARLTWNHKNILVKLLQNLSTESPPNFSKISLDCSKELQSSFSSTVITRNPSFALQFAIKSWEHRTQPAASSQLPPRSSGNGLSAMQATLVKFLSTDHACSNFAATFVAFINWNWSYPRMSFNMYHVSCQRKSKHKLNVRLISWRLFQILQAHIPLSIISRYKNCSCYPQLNVLWFVFICRTDVVFENYGSFYAE